MATNTNKSGLLTNQPNNINFLSPLGFRFTLKRAPTVNFFAVEANIPSFELGVAVVPTPFKNIEIPGDKPDYGNFELSFKIDEDMQNYLEIFNWMTSIGYPDNFKQYAGVKNAIPSSGNGVVSDGTLTIMNSAMKPTTEVRFENMFPILLSEISFSSADTAVNYITATATFKFQQMRIVPLT